MSVSKLSLVKMMKMVKEMRVRGARNWIAFGLLDLNKVRIETPMIRAIQAEADRVRSRVVIERKKAMGMSGF